MMMKDELLKRFTILVVDDHNELRDMIVENLEERGFSVLSADSAASAARLLREQQVHLLVSDLNMPDRDGLSLLKELRGDGANQEVSVLLMTGMADLTDEDCKKVGAQGVISKPFSCKDLMTSIFKTLDLSSLNRRPHEQNDFSR